MRQWARYTRAGHSLRQDCASLNTNLSGCSLCCSKLQQRKVARVGTLLEALRAGCGTTAGSQLPLLISRGSEPLVSEYRQRKRSPRTISSSSGIVELLLPLPLLLL